MPAGDNRNRVQKNWERFLRNNPKHKPGGIPRQMCEPCIVHNIGGSVVRHCYQRCVSHTLYKEMAGYLDHHEGWRCETELGPRPVLFGHPYAVHIDDPDSARRITDFLRKLPDGSGDRIAVYIGPEADSWYQVNLCGVLIQHIDLPAIRGWLRVTTTGHHRVPKLQIVR